MKKLTLQEAIEQQRKALQRIERQRVVQRAKLEALLALLPAPPRTRKRGAK